MKHYLFKTNQLFWNSALQYYRDGLKRVQAVSWPLQGAFLRLLEEAG